MRRAIVELGTALLEEADDRGTATAALEEAGGSGIGHGAS
jgi:hypothetical protein